MNIITEDRKFGPPYFYFQGGEGINNQGFDFLQRMLLLCAKNRLSTAAAALSYYLTLTFFPLMICLYTMLGSSYEKISSLLELGKSLLAPDTAILLQDFLRYVSENHNSTMLFAGLVLLISSASAAERSLHAGIGKLQGALRFQGLSGYAFSVIFAVLFLAALYFAVLVILSGRDMLAILSRYLPLLDLRSSWNWLRFILLAGIELMMIWAVYEVSKTEEEKYSTFYGAVFAALALTLVSLAFSLFIGASSRYPLVYGSLASVILLMLWLYVCCMVIYLGAAVNICLRDMEKQTPANRAGEV